MFVFFFASTYTTSKHSDPKSVKIIFPCPPKMKSRKVNNTGEIALIKDEAYGRRLILIKTCR
jgi:hypothetical protein